jgi:Zn-finger nucleic acid-binding protein
MIKSKKTYIVCCPQCNHRVFGADYADVEIKCPECRKVFEVKLEKKAG